MTICKIFIGGFWNGFFDKTDANHIGFFQLLLPFTKLSNFVIVNNPYDATVLIESYGSTFYKMPHWKYKIFFSGESHLDIPYDAYNVVLCNKLTQKNVVDLPLFVFYIHCNGFLTKLQSRPLVITAPKKFCCFISSNPDAHVRNRVFHLINSYKKIDSYGRFNNNMQTNIKDGYWTPEYHSLLSQYKFVLCFENNKSGTYITEKLINPYLANVIPIYWSTHHVKNIFNTNSMVFLENENDPKSIRDFIDKIIALDTNDAYYLECANQPMFSLDNYLDTHYSIPSLANYINCLL